MKRKYDDREVIPNIFTLEQLSIKKAPRQFSFYAIISTISPQFKKIFLVECFTVSENSKEFISTFILFKHNKLVKWHKKLKIGRIYEFTNMKNTIMKYSNNKNTTQRVIIVNTQATKLKLLQNEELVGKIHFPIIKIDKFFIYFTNKKQNSVNYENHFHIAKITGSILNYIGNGIFLFEDEKTLEKFPFIIFHLKLNESQVKTLERSKKIILYHVHRVTLPKMENKLPIYEDFVKLGNLFEYKSIIYGCSYTSMEILNNNQNEYFHDLTKSILIKKLQKMPISYGIWYLIALQFFYFYFHKLINKQFAKFENNLKQMGKIQLVNYQKYQQRKFELQNNSKYHSIELEILEKLLEYILPRKAPTSDDNFYVIEDHFSARNINAEKIVKVRDNDTINIIGASQSSIIVSESPPNVTNGNGEARPLSEPSLQRCVYSEFFDHNSYCYPFHFSKSSLHLFSTFLSGPSRFLDYHSLLPPHLKLNVQNLIFPG